MHEIIPPIGLAFWRWVVASLLVLPFVWRPLRASWPLLKAHLGRMGLLALLSVTGFNTLVYLGLQTTTATNSVLIQSTMPIQILMINALLYRTPVRGREWLSVLVSMFGVVLIVSQGQPLQLLAGHWNTGDLWILAAALTWALYSVWLKWRPEGLDGAAFLGFTLPVGTVVLLPLYVAESMTVRPMVWSMPVVLTVTYVAVFPSALAYLFWNRGVAALGANAAGQFIHLMPVFGTLMAVAFLEERLRWFHIAGGLLVAVAILTMLRAKSRSD
jgi:drug/metabolite transporter (DMT)-like permease